jgi:diketogulonate reductase-like aldo/keto reductase
MKPEQLVTTLADVQMPKILYGTAWKQERTAALVEQALALGFRGIDTACQPKHYYEAGVGEGIAACIDKGLLSRPELYLQTKFTALSGQDPLRVPYDPKASLSAQVAQSFQASLANLQTVYLDCLVLHSPLASQQQTLEVWQAMETLVENGGVKQLGISNCYDLETLQAVYRNAKTKPSVIQNRFYSETGYDRSIRQFCRDQQIIYQSFWTLSANPTVLSHSTVQNLATHYQRSPAQIFFRYLTQIGIVPLTGTSSTAHMQDSLSIFEFQLNPEECAAINALL